MSFILYFAVAAVSAQEATPQPTPRPTPDPRQAEMERLQRTEQRRQEQFNKNQLGGGTQRDVDLRKQAARIAIAALYRRSTDAELASMTADPDLYIKYAEMLKRPGTGLLRLAPAGGCTSDLALINVSPACLKYTMPGGGNSYSFRLHDYVIRRLADITFANERLDSTGQLKHGILVDLGKTDLWAISLDRISWLS